MNKAIKLYLVSLLIAYGLTLAYIVVIGLMQGVESVTHGAFLWATGAVFGLIGYQVFKGLKR